MLDLKGGLWVCRKSQKISTASDQYFLSYVKKLRGGVKLTPPPAGIGLSNKHEVGEKQIYPNLKEVFARNERVKLTAKNKRV